MAFHAVKVSVMPRSKAVIPRSSSSLLFIFYRPRSVMVSQCQGQSIIYDGLLTVPKTVMLSQGQSLKVGQASFSIMVIVEHA